jgi:hypothetical protein
LSEYRDLTKNDKIHIGDEWYNPDWEVKGPWFEIKPNNTMIGFEYDPAAMRLMRRKL